MEGRTIKQIRFGVVGCSPIGFVHADAIDQISDAALSGVMDADYSRAELLSNNYTGANVYKDLQELLQSPDIDAVSLCLPHHLHYDFCKAAIEAGKHVLIEKPLALNVAQGEALVEAARKADVRLGVVFQNRVVPAVQQLKELLQANALGDIHLVDIRVKWYRDREYYKAAWRADPDKAGGGVLVTQAIHFLDLALYLIDAVKEVFCAVSTIRPWLQVEDLALGQLRFNNGIMGNMVCSTAINPEEPAILEIHGSPGSARIQENRGLVTFHLGNQQPYADAPNAHQDASVPSLVSSEGHSIVFKDFVASILEKRNPVIDGREALKTLYLIESLYRSSKKGQWIEVGGVQKR
ncbi:Gfo/Idh/MocA family oxidoreductase [Priestia megaterium]|uniref:Gfo/Idh/MocA family protein n=1 Tax=Priestia megaterium TaxID=1404 RepID=UPI002A69E78B|nr:Gfo/Idh/MocA family oxidoreductase [Priestia megaterium]MDY0943823.1 Gfo/Idh/MocA family oxidoreductase [Priestia megaterium]